MLNIPHIIVFYKQPFDARISFFDKITLINIVDWKSNIVHLLTMETLSIDRELYSVLKVLLIFHMRILSIHIKYR